MDLPSTDKPNAIVRTRTPHLGGGEQREAKLDGLLDEVAIDSWFHLEWQDDGCWWMRIGDAGVIVRLLPDGRAEVNVSRGDYAPVLGTTTSSDEGG